MSLPYLVTLSDIIPDISELERFYFKQIAKKIVKKNIVNVIIISTNIRLKNILKRQLEKKYYKVCVYNNYK